MLLTAAAATSAYLGVTFYDESLNRVFHHGREQVPSVLTRDVAGNAPSAMSATLDTYNIVLEELPPTQARAHHALNMRDVSEVFQGIWQCRGNDQ